MEDIKQVVAGLREKMNPDVTANVYKELDPDNIGKVNLESKFCVWTLI